MGALQIGEHVLPANGEFRLRGNICRQSDGEVLMRDIELRTNTIELLNHDGEQIGRMLMGYPKGDILMVDGVEVGIGQKNDPGKLRFFGYYEDGTPGQEFGGGGVISYNVLRRDGIMEELVMINAGSKDNPVDYTGMLRILVRVSNDQNDYKVGAVVSADGGTYYTGLGKFLGWLGKHANAGEQPVAPGGGGPVTRFSTDHGTFVVNWQDDPIDHDGNAATPVKSVPRGIVYDTHGQTDESTWTAVGRLKVEPL